nr:hypothetical transcript [Hymenolepis microstoma]
MDAGIRPTVTIDRIGSNPASTSLESDSQTSSPQLYNLNFNLPIEQLEGSFLSYPRSVGTSTPQPVSEENQNIRRRNANRHSFTNAMSKFMKFLGRSLRSVSVNAGKSVYEPILRGVWSISQYFISLFALFWGQTSTQSERPIRSQPRRSSQTKTSVESAPIPSRTNQTQNRKIGTDVTESNGISTPRKSLEDLKRTPRQSHTKSNGDLSASVSNVTQASGDSASVTTVFSNQPTKARGNGTKQNPINGGPIDLASSPKSNYGTSKKHSLPTSSQPPSTVSSCPKGRNSKPTPLMSMPPPSLVMESIKVESASMGVKKRKQFLPQSPPLSKQSAKMKNNLAKETPPSKQKSPSIDSPSVENLVQRKKPEKKVASFLKTSILSSQSTPTVPVWQPRKVRRSPEVSETPKVANESTGSGLSSSPFGLPSTSVWSTASKQTESTFVPWVGQNYFGDIEFPPLGTLPPKRSSRSSVIDEVSESENSKDDKGILSPKSIWKSPTKSRSEVMREIKPTDFWMKPSKIDLEFPPLGTCQSKHPTRPSSIDEGLLPQKSKSKSSRKRKSARAQKLNDIPDCPTSYGNTEITRNVKESDHEIQDLAECLIRELTSEIVPEDQESDSSSQQEIKPLYEDYEFENMQCVRSDDDCMKSFKRPKCENSHETTASKISKNQDAGETQNISHCVEFSKMAEIESVQEVKDLSKRYESENIYGKKFPPDCAKPSEKAKNVNVPKAEYISICQEPCSRCAESQDGTLLKIEGVFNCAESLRKSKNEVMLEDRETESYIVDGIKMISNCSKSSKNRESERDPKDECKAKTTMTTSKIFPLTSTPPASASQVIEKFATISTKTVVSADISFSTSKIVVTPRPLMPTCQQCLICTRFYPIRQFSPLKCFSPKYLPKSNESTNPPNLLSIPVWSGMINSQMACLMANASDFDRRLREAGNLHSTSNWYDTSPPQQYAYQTRYLHPHADTSYLQRGNQINPMTHHHRACHYNSSLSKKSFNQSYVYYDQFLALNTTQYFAPTSSQNIFQPLHDNTVREHRKRRSSTGQIFNDNNVLSTKELASDQELSDLMLYSSTHRSVTDLSSILFKEEENMDSFYPPEWNSTFDATSTDMNEPALNSSLRCELEQLTESRYQSMIMHENRGRNRPGVEMELDLLKNIQVADCDNYIPSNLLENLTMDDSFSGNDFDRTVGSQLASTENPPSTMESNEAFQDVPDAFDLFEKTWLPSSLPWRSRFSVGESTHDPDFLEPTFHSDVPGPTIQDLNETMTVTNDETARPRLTTDTDQTFFVEVEE